MGNQVVQDGSGLIRFTVPLKTMLRCSTTCTNLMRVEDPGYPIYHQCRFPEFDLPLPLDQDEHQQLIPHRYCRKMLTRGRDLALVEIK